MKKLVVFISWLVLTILFSSFTLSAQSLNELKNKKDKIESEIKYLNELIEKGSKSRSVSLNKLSVLNRKIEVREELIINLKNEIDYYNLLLSNNKTEVSRLKEKLRFLNKQYASVIYYSWKNRVPENKLIFLFSSENFNQAYKRLKYFKQYSYYSMKLAENINKTNDSLINVNSDLIKIIDKKNVLLNSHSKEKLVLAQEKLGYKSLISKLKNQERSIKRKLDKQLKYQSRLVAEIERIIKENSLRSKVTASDINLAREFSSNRGKLPWPTQSGFVSSAYGLHAHPVSKRTKIRNDGIDITTNENSSCLSVFSGVVSEVFNFPGLNNIIMVRHGSYLTVYANLKDVYVRKGDVIKTGQIIGKIFTDPDDKKTVLKFQVWKESQKMNPQDWLSR